MNKERKKILILSQEPWNFLFLSKQNYALAFQEKGYDVYFLTFPSVKMGWKFNITKDSYTHKINLINYSIPLPHFVKFKMGWLYKLVNKIFILNKFINKHKNSPFDIAIDFGLYYYLYSDMNWTNAKKKIFFPVDNSDLLPKKYEGADAILSVTDFILQRYANGTTPTHFINHGLANEYANEALLNLTKVNEPYTVNGRVKLGYIGNLNIPFLDKNLLLQLINTLPEVDFMFYGKLEKQVDPDFYTKITSYKNVYFGGHLQPDELSKALQLIDGFLMCYTAECNEKISGNSHKIIEYLSTGKVLFTTYIKLYEQFPFVQMSPQNDRNEFITLVKNGVNNIVALNNSQLRESRIKFSLANTYSNNVEKIEKLIGV